MFVIFGKLDRKAHEILRLNWSPIESFHARNLKILWGGPDPPLQETTCPVPFFDVSVLRLGCSLPSFFSTENGPKQ